MRALSGYIRAALLATGIVLLARAVSSPSWFLAIIGGVLIGYYDAWSHSE